MVFSSVIQNVMTSIGEAEYAAAFFHTAQMAAGLRKTLSDLGYPQPATYNLVDNEEVASEIANNTIKPKCTKSIGMQFHWLRDRAVQIQEFIFIWRKGVYNLADFFTKPTFIGQGSLKNLNASPCSGPIFLSSFAYSLRFSNSTLARLPRCKNINTLNRGDDLYQFSTFLIFNLASVL